MVESSEEPSSLDPSRSSPGTTYASSHRYRFRAGSQDQVFTVSANPSTKDAGISSRLPADHGNTLQAGSPVSPSGNDVPNDTIKGLPPPAPPPPEKGQGEEPSSIGSEEQERKPIILLRVYRCCKGILFASWINVLLVFVPIAIAVQAAGVDKTIVFAMNAIAIIPLAGLLSYATESVASDLGDTIGSLMNVTFGNAVELIILQVFLFDY